MNAKYNKGVIKKTENQRKKHVKQMTRKEQWYLREQIKNLPNIRFTQHALNNNIDVTIEQIKNTIKEYNYIIEYNETTDTYGKINRRVLVRSSRVYKVNFHKIDGSVIKGNANLCFVVSIDTGYIVTTYYNFINDGHRTIDMRRYDKTLKIIK